MAWNSGKKAAVLWSFYFLRLSSIIRDKGQNLLHLIYIFIYCIYTFIWQMYLSKLLSFSYDAFQYRIKWDGKEKKSKLGNIFTFRYTMWNQSIIFTITISLSIQHLFNRLFCRKFCRNIFIALEKWKIQFSSSMSSFCSYGLECITLTRDLFLPT